MGSLNNGQPIVKSTNVLRHSHNGNYVRQSDTSTDTEAPNIANSGTIRTNNYAFPFGVEFQPSGIRTFVSGLSLEGRDLSVSAPGTGIQALEFLKFQNDSGNLKHVVTRAMGIHTSIHDRESPNSTLGPMVARTERKVFFIDSDTAKASGFADWEIYTADGCPSGTALGVTDTDITPAPTWDVPC